MNTTTTKKIYLNGTIANKIASKGFLTRLDCKQYLQSTTLSPLNEKFFAMVYNEIVFNKNNVIKLLAKNNNAAFYNGFKMEVTDFKRNKYNTKIVLLVKAINSIKDKQKNAILTINYKNGGKISEVIPHKYEGLVFSYKYYDNIYNSALFHYNKYHQRVIDNIYYHSYKYDIKYIYE